MSQHPESYHQASGQGGHSHEVHLIHRKTEVSDKPGVHNWSSQEYSASLAAEAQQRQARYEQAATALPPWAADAGGLKRVGSGSSTSSTGLLHVPQHMAPSPATKVGSTSFGNEAYAAARQESAAAKQQRFQAAATAPAPFAVDQGTGGTSGAGPSAGTYHYHKPQQAEPAGKVGCLPDGAAHVHLLHKASEHDEHELTTKVTGLEWNQQQAEENCRQRQVAQAASRRRNWGTEGLLG